MDSITSNSGSEIDQMSSNNDLVGNKTKHLKINCKLQQPLPLTHNETSAAVGDDQINSLESLKLLQDSKRSSFLISNTRKLQILKQIHLMSSQELYGVCLQILQKSSVERNHFDLQILQKTFSSIQFFQNFEETSGQNALLNLYKKLQLETYDIHDLVIQQGTKGDKFYIILQGSVDIFIKPAAGMSPALSPQNSVSQSSSRNKANKHKNKLKNANSATVPNTLSQQIIYSSNSINESKRSAAAVSSSPFSRQQQSPKDISKNMSAFINSQHKLEQQTRERSHSNNSSSSDPIIQNANFNIQTFSQITSDTVLEEQLRQPTITFNSNSFQEQKSEQNHNRSSIKQKSSLKNSMNSNEPSQQITSGKLSVPSMSNYSQSKGSQQIGRQSNLSNHSNAQQTQNLTIPLTQLEEIENNSQVKTQNVNSSQTQSQANNESEIVSKVQQNGENIHNPSIQAKVQQYQYQQNNTFGDNQVFTFLNIISQKQQNNRIIFPPDQQKHWQKVNQMFAGSSFGELALLNDAPRMANVVCNQVCHFAVLSKKDFREVVASVESQKIKGYIQFLQGVPGFDKISRRALNMIVYSFEVKTYTFRDVIFREKQKADYLYIAKEGEFCLQQSVDYQPPKDPARYNYEEFNTKYKPAIYNKAVRKAQIAVLSRGELFGDYEVFAEIPRCMDAICKSQKGEVFCISIQNLTNRCEILNDRELLANLKQNSLQKHGIHQKMLQYIYGTSSSFQDILVNNQKLIADQRSTDCINTNNPQTQRGSRNRLASSSNQPLNTNTKQQTQNISNTQNTDSLYEPTLQYSNLLQIPRGKSAPSSARQRNYKKKQQNNFFQEQNNSRNIKQSNSQCDTNRSSMNKMPGKPERFSDLLYDNTISSSKEKNLLLQSQLRQTTTANTASRIEGETAQNESQTNNKKVPRINISKVKLQLAQSSQLSSQSQQASNRPQSSERSFHIHNTSTSRNRFNVVNRGDTQFIQISNQSATQNQNTQNYDHQAQILDSSNIFSQNKQRQKYSFSQEKSMFRRHQGLDNLKIPLSENTLSNSLVIKANEHIPVTSVVRKDQAEDINEKQQHFEKKLKSENMIKAKKMIIKQLNTQKQVKGQSTYVDITQNASVLSSTSYQNNTNNKAVDSSFQPSLAFSKLQINSQVDYNETRKQVLRKMRKFKQIDYLKEKKKTKQFEGVLQSNEFTKIQTVRNKACVVINPHAFINFVNIS